MISIIVPIFNTANYLKACLTSLVQQTERDLQIILVDDGCTDDSATIARDFANHDDRIELYEQAHAGQSAARNLGLTHVKGEYIAFVDADDCIEPDWCERHLAAIQGVDYVQSQCPSNKYQYTVVWGRLYRSKAIQHIRFTEGMIYEDVLWSVDLWLSGATCRSIKYCGYHYTVNPFSTTSQRRPEAELRVFQALNDRLHHASLRGKIIILYTILRLKLHYLKQ